MPSRQLYFLALDAPVDEQIFSLDVQSDWDLSWLRDVLRLHCSCYKDVFPDQIKVWVLTRYLDEHIPAASYLDTDKLTYKGVSLDKVGAMRTIVSYFQEPFKSGEANQIHLILKIASGMPTVLSMIASLYSALRSNFSLHPSLTCYSIQDKDLHTLWERTWLAPKDTVPFCFRRPIQRDNTLQEIATPSFCWFMELPNDISTALGLCVDKLLLRDDYFEALQATFRILSLPVSSAEGPKTFAAFTNPNSVTETASHGTLAAEINPFLSLEANAKEDVSTNHEPFILTGSPGIGKQLHWGKIGR
jgi:hypothetical protein